MKTTSPAPYLFTPTHRLASAQMVVAAGVHCMVYACPVIGLNAMMISPGCEYQEIRTLSANSQLVSAVATPVNPEGQTVNVSASAVETAKLIAPAAANPASEQSVKPLFNFPPTASRTLGD